MANSDGDDVGVYLFFGKNDPFSQFFPCRFTVDGKEYGCTEQWMMASKARLFNDADREALIMASRVPKEQKSHGRKVKGFDEATWRASRFDIVVKGNYAKFSQNPTLRLALLETGDKKLAEASPFDRIWGIGMAASNPNSSNPAKWRGSNLLGKALMHVRQQLLAEQQDENADAVEKEDNGEDVPLRVVAPKTKRRKVAKSPAPSTCQRHGPIQLRRNPSHPH